MTARSESGNTVRSVSRQRPVIELPAYNDWDLLVRTSWVDADAAYTQIRKNRATGNIPALRLRAWLQIHLFNLGCVVQAKCGTVLFLGMLFLSLSCIGLKTVTLETNLEKLWVEEGGRLAKELAYTTKILGEESGTTNEIIIQTPKNRGSILSVESMIAHLQAVKSVVRLSVDIFDTKWTFKDICHAASFASFNDGAFLDQILSDLAPCIIVTPLDCFWEGSKLLGPDYGIYVPGFSHHVKWSNLNPQDILAVIEDYPLLSRQIEQIKIMMNRAGITTGYMSKACLNPNDPDCPISAPNYSSKQPPDIGAELTKGCAGFATKLMKWENDLIVGGVKRNKSGHIIRAEALQTIVQLMGARDLFEFHRDTNKMLRIDWSLEKARIVLESWQRLFTLEVEKLANSTKSENIYPFSSMSLADMLQDFSQFSYVKVILGYLFMLIYVGVAMIKWNNSVRSQGGIGVAGVLLVALSVAAGLGISSVAGIKFNASTTQIVPFLALGLGVDDLFLITNTLAEFASKHTIPYMEMTGECLKRMGPGMLLKSLSNMVAFAIGAIIPIPALRAFCLQCAILIAFNTTTILFVFLAVVSLDLRRQEEGRVDIFCCFKTINLPQMSNISLESNPETASRSWSSTGQSGSFTGQSWSSTGQSGSSTVQSGLVTSQSESTTGQPGPVTGQSGSGAGHLRSVQPCEPGHQDRGRMQSSLVTNADGSSPSTVLQFAPEYERCVVRNAVCPTPGLLPVASSFTPSTWNASDHCQDCLLQTCRCWSLTRFARYCYAPFLGRTLTKVMVVFAFLALLGAGIVGTARMTNGLDITDVVPRGTSEHRFLEARSKYFGFYNFFAVTKNTFDYHTAAGQRLLMEYYKAFNQVDAIIRKEDGTLPTFWLHSFRNWLIDKQNAFDRDYQMKCFYGNDWCKNVSSDGLLGYKLMIQTGELDEPIDKQRAESGRLVDSDGIINSNAFYNYLTAWVSNDAMAYGISQASLHPMPKEWFHDVQDRELRIPKSQSIVYAQLAFHLHHLDDTEVITSTIKVIRDICETFTARGLPNYPQGIPFTFWEQYLHLMHYLLLALVSILGFIFLLLSIFFFNVWIAIIMVVVLSMEVVELSGVMGFFEIQMSAIPAIIMVFSVGIGAEFTIYISISFLTNIGSRTRRAQMALHHVFAPVVHGALTTIIGIVMLLGTDFDFIFRYFFIELLAVVLLCLMNGLILLPVLLSVIGPTAEVTPCNGMDYLLPPTPPHSPHPTSDKPCTGRRPPPRIPCNISLTTIAEEPSHFSSSSDSKISVHVHPEVLVQTTAPCGTTTTTFMDKGGRNKSFCESHPIPSTSSMPHCSTTAPRQHVTTVKASAKVKVKVHTISPGSTESVKVESHPKSKEKKLPEICSSSSPPLPGSRGQT